MTEAATAAPITTTTIAAAAATTTGAPLLPSKAVQIMSHILCNWGSVERSNSAGGCEGGRGRGRGWRCVALVVAMLQHQLRAPNSSSSSNCKNNNNCGPQPKPKEIVSERLCSAAAAAAESVVSVLLVVDSKLFRLNNCSFGSTLNHSRAELPIIAIHGLIGVLTTKKKQNFECNFSNLLRLNGK